MIAEPSRAIRLALSASVFACIQLSACSSGTEPRTAAAITPAVSRSVQAIVGTVTDPVPAVIAITDDGEPVSGVPITFAVAGGGSIAVTDTVTGADGTASVGSWTLGTVAGQQTVTAMAEGLQPAVFTANAVPDEPVRLRATVGKDQIGTVGMAAPSSPEVKVVDRYENGVPGIEVHFTVQLGRGSLDGDVDTSDAQGIARSGTWTLDTLVGTNRVLASAAGDIVQVLFLCSGEHGGPATLIKVEGDGQSALPGSAVSVPPKVRVEDAYGNPVPNTQVSFTSTSGGGSVTGGNATSDNGGHATVGGWTLGAAGTNTLEASVAGGPSAIFTATATSSPPSVNLFIGPISLSQSTQQSSGIVPLVAGRDAYMRIFGQASGSNSATPGVRVRFYRSGTLLQTFMVPASGTEVPQTFDEGVLQSSWNLLVPGSVIQPGLSFIADIDPDNAIPEFNEGDNYYGSSTPHDVDVKSVEQLEISFVPITSSPNGLTGRVDAGNAAQFVAKLKAMMPVAGVDAVVHAPLSVDTVPTSDNANQSWSVILSQVNALRAIEGSSRFYVGVLRATYSSGIAGLGYVPGKAVISWDFMPSASEVIAHEMGHNWGRFHSPCGGAGNPDPNYPYAGGVTGVYGIDVGAEVLKPPTMFDIMGYCSGKWISDYTYTAILNYRLSHTTTGSAMAAVQPSLLVWGRITAAGTVILEPAFQVVARPSQNSSGGDLLVQGLAEDGSVLFDRRFQTRVVADAESGERQFAFTIPLSSAAAAQLSSLRVSGPGGSAQRVREQAAAGSGALARATREAVAVGNASTETVVRWDSTRFPMALIRDARTGQVLAFSRSGTARVHTSGGAVEVSLSDGIGSISRQIPVSQP